MCIQKNLYRDRLAESWEEKLKEQAELSKIKESELRDENKMKKTVAHLWNLNEDSQLTNMVRFVYLDNFNEILDSTR